MDARTINVESIDNGSYTDCQVISKVSDGVDIEVDKTMDSFSR